MKTKTYTLFAISFLLTLLSADVFGQSWCTPSLSGPNDHGITNVTLNTLNRTSAYDEGYVLTTDSTNLEIGSNYTLSVTFYDINAPAIWIDWNQDGDFDDAQEDIVGSLWYPVYTPGASTVKTVSVSVPASATLGVTRMRVYSKSFGSGPVSSPCDTVDNGGDIEDYHILIQSPFSSVNTKNEREDSGFSIYPNPNSGQFTVKALNHKNGGVIKIFNLLGEIVYNESYESELINVDISDLANGIYVIELDDELLRFCKF